MSVGDACIGVENKDNIRNLSEQIELLKLKITHLEDNTVKITVLHNFEMKLNSVESQLKEMKNNRTEDREAISKLNHSVEEVSSQLEEYLVGNAKLLAHQINYQIEQKHFKEKLDMVLDGVEKLNGKIEEEIKDVNEKIKQSSISNQLKTFYNKSKFNKWISRLAMLMLAVLIVSIFIFFTSGVVGADNLKKTMDFIKGWVI